MYDIIVWFAYLTSEFSVLRLLNFCVLLDSFYQWDFRCLYLILYHQYLKCVRFIFNIISTTWKILWRISGGNRKWFFEDSSLSSAILNPSQHSETNHPQLSCEFSRRYPRWYFNQSLFSCGSWKLSKMESALAIKLKIYFQHFSIQPQITYSHLQKSWKFTSGPSLIIKLVRFIAIRALKLKVWFFLIAIFFRALKINWKENHFHSIFRAPKIKLYNINF